VERKRKGFVEVEGADLGYSVRGGDIFTVGRW